MGARQVAELAQQRLQGEPIKLTVPMTARPGSFANPSVIEWELEGTKRHSQFWEGSHPDKKIAYHVIMDVLCAHWNCSEREAEARLQHLETQAQR